MEIASLRSLLRRERPTSTDKPKPSRWRAGGKSSDTIQTSTRLSVPWRISTQTLAWPPAPITTKWSGARVALGGIFDRSADVCRAVTNWANGAPP